MSRTRHAPTSLPAETAVEKYYRFHSRIYDATRWSFLFGRTAIIKKFAGTAPRNILEVGCGTGRNLVELARRFPQAQVTGVDLSATMLDLARRKTADFGPRLQLLHQAYTAPLSEPWPPPGATWCPGATLPWWTFTIRASGSSLAGWE
jgi:S-adenosylmethionine-diacylgycerolhomoserine-N-methlytransferase